MAGWIWTGWNAGAGNRRDILGPANARGRRRRAWRVRPTRRDGIWMGWDGIHRGQPKTCPSLIVDVLAMMYPSDRAYGPYASARVPTDVSGL